MTEPHPLTGSPIPAKPALHPPGNGVRNMRELPALPGPIASALVALMTDAHDTNEQFVLDAVVFTHLRGNYAPPEYGSGGPHDRAIALVRGAFDRVSRAVADGKAHLYPNVDLRT